MFTAQVSMAGLKLTEVLYNEALVTVEPMIGSPVLL